MPTSGEKHRMLATLSKGFTVLASGPAAKAGQLKELKGHYPDIPDEYLHVIDEVTELELRHSSGQYLRIWGPNGCAEMDRAYGISKRIPGAISIGDDGGGQVIFYMNGGSGFGLYHVGYGDLDTDDAVFIAFSLSDLLEHAIGIDTF
jgi:hypothetical protein